MGEVINFSEYKVKKEMRLAGISPVLRDFDLEEGMKLIFDAMNISPEDLALIRGEKTIQKTRRKKQ